MVKFKINKANKEKKEIVKKLNNLIELLISKGLITEEELEEV